MLRLHLALLRLPKVLPGLRLLRLRRSGLACAALMTRRGRAAVATLDMHAAHPLLALAKERARAVMLLPIGRQ